MLQIRKFAEQNESLMGRYFVVLMEYRSEIRMNTNKRIFLRFFILIALVSGVITFFIISNHETTRKKEEQTLAKNAKQNTKLAQWTTISEILNGVEEVYLESYFDLDNLVTMNREDLKIINERLKSLDSKLVAVDTQECEDYLYAIHIKNKNIKIKISDKYFIVEDVKEGTQFFIIENNLQRYLIQELETIYMRKYNDDDMFKNPKSISIMAKDENKQWILNKKEERELLDNIHFIAPVAKEKVVNLPSDYPDYHITITKNDKDYRIRLINQKILELDLLDIYAYYQYDAKLFHYVSKKYAVAFKENPSSFYYLLKSEKVAVDDRKDIFDFEDDTYYHIELPRWLIKAEKKEINRKPKADSWLFTLRFTVEGNIKEVKIYENEILYNNKIYYSKKIGEAIQSLLNAQ